MSAAPLTVIAPHWLPTTPPTPAPDMLTVEETCLMLGCRETQLKTWNTRGWLKRKSVQTERPYALEDILEFTKRMPVGQQRNRD